MGAACLFNLYKISLFNKLLVKSEAHNNFKIIYLQAYLLTMVMI